MIDGTTTRSVNKFHLYTNAMAQLHFIETEEATQRCHLILYPHLFKSTSASKKWQRASDTTFWGTAFFKFHVV